MDDWNLFHTFLAAAREGTLTAAAETLGTSVSTVHRQVALLEEHLDTRLFERRGRGQVLTAAGEALRDRASRIEEEVLAIGRDVLGRDESLRGVVRLTTTDTIANRLLPRHLPRLRERHPNVQLEILVDNRHYRLGRGEADVALRPGAKPREPDVVPRQVGEVHLAWYASRDYLRRAGRPRRRSELRRHDAVVPDVSLAHIAYGRLAAEYTDPKRHVVRSPSLLAQAAAVRAGAGIGVLPCFLLDDDPGVQRLFSPEPEAPLWLLYHADLRRTARVQAVVELLREAIAADEPLLTGTAG